MPDITMCLDHLCPERQDCYRYRAVASLFGQSWQPTFRTHRDRSCPKVKPIPKGSIIRVLHDCDAYAKQEKGKR